MILLYVQEMQMRTTLYVNEKLVQSIKKYTGTMNKTEIINTALEEFLSKLKREKIKQAYGNIKIDLKVREFRNKELNE
jgi:hypothetical protein